MADITNLTNFLNDVAGAIKEKTGKEEKIPAANFDTEILSIEGGTDTSDATATQKDIIQGKTAYGAEGKITGSFVPPEPIYGVDELNINDTGITIARNTSYVSFNKIDNFIGIMNTDGTSHGQIYKINEMNEKELLFEISNCRSIMLLDVIENDIYYFYISSDSSTSTSSTTLSIYKLNTITKENELYWEYSFSSSIYLDNIGFVDRSKIIYDYSSSSQYFELDLLNKQEIKHLTLNFEPTCLNKTIVSNMNFSSTILCDLTTGNKSTLKDKYIAFVNKDNTKVGVLNRSSGTNIDIYELSARYDVGFINKRKCK